MNATQQEITLTAATVTDARRIWRGMEVMGLTVEAKLDGYWSDAVGVPCYEGARVLRVGRDYVLAVTPEGPRRYRPDADAPSYARPTIVITGRTTEGQ